MSESDTITIPDHASGHLVYIGRDTTDDVAGAMATIGAALHFAADHLELFRQETNDHHARHHGDDGALTPTLEQYRAVIVFAHELASPGCVEPIP